MKEIPLELKLHVCRLLAPKDLKPLRLTCKALKEAADPYLISRFILYNRQESIDALHDIASHPVFSKRLTTMVYDPSLLKNYPDVERWNSLKQIDHLPRFSNYRAQSDEGPAQGRFQRALLDMHNRYEDDTRRIKAAIDPAWKTHQNLVQTQSTEGFFNRVADALTAAFATCPKLQCFIVSFGHPEGVNENKSHVLKDIFPDADTWDHEATSDVRRVLRRTTGSGLQLNTLFINARYLHHLADNPDTLAKVKHLRLSFMPRDWRFQHLPNTIKTIRSLETLILGIGLNPPGKDKVRFAANDILGAVRSDALRTCRLNHFDASENSLVRFLLCHAPTLQRLSLGGGMYGGSSWPSVIARLAGQFPNLKRLQLTFMHDAGQERAYSSEYRMQSERFIMFGGVQPVVSFKGDEGSKEQEQDHLGALIDKKDLVDELEDGMCQDYEELLLLT